MALLILEALLGSSTWVSPHMAQVQLYLHTQSLGNPLWSLTLLPQAHSNAGAPGVQP